MLKSRRYNVKAAPLNWQSSNLVCGRRRHFALKRNYHAVIDDLGGGRYSYTILESSPRQPVVVLKMEASSFPYDIRQRAEQLLRSFAKGYKSALNATEQALIGTEYGEWNPDNVKFIPYPSDVM